MFGLFNLSREAPQGSYCCIILHFLVYPCPRATVSRKVHLNILLVVASLDSLTFIVHNDAFAEFSPLASTLQLIVWFYFKS